MSLYQNKTTPFEAVQWTGSNANEIKAFIGEHKAFDMMDDKLIRIQEKDDNIDYIPLNYYIFLKENTFVSSNPEVFEKHYELKEKDIFFEKIPIVIFNVLDVANEGVSTSWSVQIPDNYRDFENGFFSKIKFVDCSTILNLAFLELRTFDDEKTEYVSLSEAEVVAEYMKDWLGGDENCDIVIFA